jgi:hypothetical protein
MYLPRDPADQVAIEQHMPAMYHDDVLDVVR